MQAIAADAAGAIRAWARTETGAPGHDQLNRPRPAAAHENAKWLVQERPAGTYLRQFSLGDGVDTSRIAASYDNGVLSAIVPVSEKDKPRKITIETSAQADAPASISI